MKAIRINHPGDGAWIMQQVHGRFDPEVDVSIVNHRDGKAAGGFVITGYTGASAFVHMAGDDTRWCSRDLMWMVFNYAFVQLHLRKLFAPVAASNYIALGQDLRAGFMIETVLRDAYHDGDMLVLSMTPDTCRWLDMRPREYVPGEAARAA